MNAPARYVVQHWLRDVRALGIAAMALIMAGCGGSSGTAAGPQPGGGDDPKTKPNVLLEAPAEVLKPFIWYQSSTADLEAGFDAELAYGDPLRATTVLMLDWLAKRDVPRASRMIAKMSDKWRLDAAEPRLSYGFAYGRLPVGWRSAMDSWALPLLLYSVWQQGGDEALRAMADRLIRVAMKGVSEGGVVWYADQGCWFSEYAWDGMVVEDEFRVLNGHLHALQAVKMLADLTGRADLKSLYACGLSGTKALDAEFRLGQSWVPYMLNPSVINQTHYVVFETMEYDALGILDPDPYFSQEAARRRRLLQRYFPVRITQSPSGNKLFLAAVGAPHPYSVDTYPWKVACTDGGATEQLELVRPNDARLPILDRAFLEVPTALDPARTTCQVDASYAGLRHKLYEAPVQLRDAAAAPGRELPAALSAALDASLESPARVLVDPAVRQSPPNAPENYLDTQGRVVFEPDASVPWRPEELLGIEFGADGPMAVGVSIMSRGVEYFRYYPRTLAAPRQIVLLSPVGFDGGDGITGIDRVTLFIYTDRQPGPVRISAPRLLKFGDQLELYRYFTQLRPAFHTE